MRRGQLASASLSEIRACTSHRAASCSSSFSLPPSQRQRLTSSCQLEHRTAPPHAPAWLARRALRSSPPLSFGQTLTPALTASQRGVHAARGVRSAASGTQESRVAPKGKKKKSSPQHHNNNNHYHRRKKGYSGAHDHSRASQPLHRTLSVGKAGGATPSATARAATAQGKKEEMHGRKQSRKGRAGSLRMSTGSPAPAAAAGAERSGGKASSTPTSFSFLARTPSRRHGPHDDAHDDRKLRKLFHVHGVIWRNYRALQNSERVYQSLCRMCLGALESSRLLSRLADAVAEGSEPQKTVEACAHLHVHVDRCRDAATEEEAVLRVRVPVTLIRWLNSSITLPELSHKTLLAACAGDVTAARQAVDMWQQHCGRRGQGQGLGLTAPVVAALEDALGAVRPQYKSHTHSPLSRGTRSEDDGTEEAKTGSGSTTASAVFPSAPAMVDGEMAEMVLRFLTTASLFKWVKDDAALRRGTDSLKETSAVGESEDADVPSRVRVICACLQELQSLHGEDNGVGTEGKTTTAKDLLSGDVDVLQTLKRRLRPTQEVLKQSVAILNTIPKVDRVCVLHRLPSSAGAEAEQKGTTADTEATYTAHVLDLYLSVFLRYALAAWPHFPSSAQSGTLFSLLAQPWFSTDVAGDAAMWFTVWELRRPSLSLRRWADDVPATADGAADATAFAKGSAEDHRSEEMKRNSHQKTLAASFAAASAGGSPIACQDYATYVKQLRLLCWPTVLDRHSAIAQRTLSGGSGSGGQGLPDMKELAMVLHSSERKQRLAYELMCVYLFRLRGELEALTREGGEDVVQSLLAVASQPRSASSLAVFVTDVDRFVSDRFFSGFHRKGRWLLLPSSSSTLPLPVGREGTKTGGEGHDAATFTQLLSTEVHHQSAEPCQLTRLALPVLCVLLVSQWAAHHNTRGVLLFDAIARAVDAPCQHVFAFRTAQQQRRKKEEEEEVEQGEGSSWPPLLSRGVQRWTHVLAPLLPFCGEKPFQQFMWRHLLRQMKQLTEKPEAGAAVPAADVEASSRAAVSTRNGKEIVVRLVRLGYLSAFLLSAQRASAEASAPPLSSPSSPSPSMEREREEFHAAIRIRFHKTTMAVLNGIGAGTCDGTRPCPSLNEIIDAVHAHLMPNWPVEELAGDTRAALSQRTPSMLVCHDILASTVFTAELLAEVETWLARRAAVQRRQQGVHGVSDPLLLHWFGLVQEEELGLQALPLTLPALYQGLWQLVSSRRAGGGEDGVESAPAPPAGSEGENEGRVPSVEPDRVRLSPEELAVVLHVMGGVQARGGLGTLHALNEHVSCGNSSGASARTSRDASSAAEPRMPLPAIFENMASIASRAEPAVQRRVKQQEARDAAPTGADAEVPATATLSPSLIRQHLRVIQQALQASITRNLHVMPTAARLDAVYLGLLPMEEAAACGTRTVHETQLQLEKELTASPRHALFISELLLMKYVACIGPHAPGERRGGLDAFLFSLLEAAVRVEGQLAVQRRTAGEALADRSASGEVQTLEEQITANSGRNGALATMADHARCVARAHAVSAYLFLLARENGGVDPAAPSCPRDIDTTSLFALLLLCLGDSVGTAASRGNAEELLLWLATSALIVQRSLQPLLRVEVESAEGFSSCAPPRWPARLPSQPAAAAAVVVEEEARQRAEDRLAHPSRSLLELIGVSAWASTSAAGAATPHTQQGAPRREDIALLRQWLRHVFTRLSPLVLSSIGANSQDKEKAVPGRPGHSGGGSPSPRHTVYLSLAMRALQETGIPSSGNLRLLTDQLLQRTMQNRRHVPQHHRLLLAAVAAQTPALSSPMASHGVLPLAAFLKDARDVLTRDELHEAFLLIRATAEATTNPPPAMTAASTLSASPDEGRDRRFDSQRAAAVEDGEGNRRDGGRADVEGEGGGAEPVPAYTTQPMFPVLRPPAPVLRGAWAALAKRLLDAVAEEEGRHSLTPSSPSSRPATSCSGSLVHLLVLALSCGAAVECVDTHVFARLLAATALLADDGEGLSLTEWSVLLRACSAAPGPERRDMADFLHAPLAAQMAALKRDPTMWQLSDKARESNAVNGGRGDSTVAMRCASARRQAVRERAQGLCLLLEALPPLFTGADGFWEGVSEVVQGCAEALVEGNQADRGSEEEARFWVEEWVRSYNWAVQTAGHAGLQMETAADEKGFRTD